DGMAFTVTEDEILDALKELATVEGHFVEPAGALPLAAFKKHQDKFEGKKCLFVVTGTGFKDTKVVTKHSLSSPVLSDDLEKVIKYVNSGFIEMQKKSWGKSRDTFMADLKMGEEHEQLYNEYVNKYNKKGKTLSNKEIEAIQSLIFDEDADLQYPVEVLDYKLTKYVNSGFIEMQKKSWGKSRDTFMADLKMGEEHEQLYNEYVNKYNKKGKTLSNKEIEAIQSLIFDEDADLQYPVEVLDYKLT